MEPVLHMKSYLQNQQVHRVNNMLPEFEEFNAECEKGILHVLGSVKLVFSTLHSVDHVKHDDFDVVIIDEAGQTLDIDAWGALLKANRCIIAGDQHQLPPVISKPHLINKCFKTTTCRSLQARAVLSDEQACEQFPLDYESRVMFLDTQYRMNEKILAWSNKTFYDDKVESGAQVFDRVIHADLKPLTVYEVKGSERKNGTSFENAGEANRIVNYVNMLQQEYGIESSRIGIITAYKQQKYRIKQEFMSSSKNVKRSRNQVNIFSGEDINSTKDIKISTVDSFQGGEMDVIIISLVRSNAEHKIGFLADLRRLNVAVTRAKMHAVLFCNTMTLMDNEALMSLVTDYAEKDVLLDDYLKRSVLGMRTIKRIKDRRTDKRFEDEMRFRRQAEKCLSFQEIDEKLKKKFGLDEEHEKGLKAATDQLQIFLNDDKRQTTRFGTNSYIRARLHYICRMVGGLSHESLDINGNRVLVVSKMKGRKRRRKGNEGIESLTVFQT